MDDQERAEIETELRRRFSQDELDDLFDNEREEWKRQLMAAAMHVAGRKGDVYEPERRAFLLSSTLSIE